MPIFGWGDEVPDEALDLIVSFVVPYTVDQQSPAHQLHVPLRQVPLEAAMGEDVLPSPPATWDRQRR